MSDSENSSQSGRDDSSQSDSDDSSQSDSDDHQGNTGSLSTSDDQPDDSHDMDEYNKIKVSQIFISHKSDADLQTRTASHFVAQADHQGSIATTFKCPDPHCNDELLSGTPIHAWYLHLELPKHRSFLDKCGQFSCLFKCGRSFVDEWQEFIHYNSRICPNMDRSASYSKYTCPKGMKSILQNHCHYHKNWEYRSISHAVMHWIRKHGPQRYNLPGFVSCHVCKIGFLDQSMYANHFQIGYGDGKVESNPYAAALRELGLA